MIQKKSILLDAPFSCNKRARDGARGPVDLGFARTEAHFMWAETSNLVWILIHAIVKSPFGLFLHEKRGIHLDAPFSCNKRARDGARGPVDLGFARTEAHFMWAETSNLVWILIHAIVKSPFGLFLHEKRISIKDILFV